MDRTQILEGLGAGARTIQEMVARISASVPKGQHGLAEESVWNRLVRLEGENRVHRMAMDGKECYELLA